MTEDRKVAYLAGKMRGVEHMNFPAFAAATAELRAAGWTVISPAEMDVENGFDGSRDPSEAELLEMCERDLAAGDVVDTIILLPGWQDSEGVKVELRHASRRKPLRPSLAVYIGAGEVQPIEWSDRTDLVTA